MKRLKCLLILVLMVLPLFSSLACSKKNQKIKKDVFDISVVYWKSADSFTAYIGDGPVINYPNPFGDGMSLITMIQGEDGKTYAYTAGDVTAKDNSILVMVRIEIKNVSKSTQTFKIGDISINGDKKGSFLAVGADKYLFAKNGSDINTVKKKSYELDPGNEHRFVYLFSLPKEKTPRWSLVYRGKHKVDLNSE